MQHDLTFERAVQMTVNLREGDICNFAQNCKNYIVRKDVNSINFDGTAECHNSAKSERDDARGSKCVCPGQEYAFTYRCAYEVGLKPIQLCI